MDKYMSLAGRKVKTEGKKLKEKDRDINLEKQMLVRMLLCKLLRPALWHNNRLLKLLAYLNFYMSLSFFMCVCACTCRYLLGEWCTMKINRGGWLIAPLHQAKWLFTEMLHMPQYWRRASEMCGVIVRKIFSSSWLMGLGHALSPKILRLI